MITFYLIDPKTELRRGDIFFTRGNALISKLIRIFSRVGGESRTRVNHIGVVVNDDSEAIVVEALSKVKRHKLWDEYGNSKTRIAVYRPTSLTSDEIDLIVGKAESYVGCSYGYGKIFAHLGDWLLGGRYFFRRFASMDKYPICSWVVADAYAAANKNFGCPVGMAEPDDIWDFVNAHPDKYEVIWKL